MKEKDYILVDNKARVTIALNAILDCSHGDEYGFHSDDFADIAKTLAETQIRLFNMINTEPDNDNS